jgi:hypothetical protein
MSLKRSFACVLLLLVVGCQPVPRPFADLAKAPSMPALRPPDAAGVRVVATENAPAAADALAKALRALDVPASTAAQNRGSYRVETVSPSGPGGGLGWVLKNAPGTTLGQGTAASPTEAASAIARLVTGDAPAPVDVPALVAVRQVSGAPGDGDTSLARAIESTLGRAGIDVGAAAGRFALTCVVAVTPAQKGRQTVSVRWVLALPAGRKLGEVGQQNEVPAGALDKMWGDIAYDVASAATPGIVQLIERARSEAAGS